MTYYGKDMKMYGREKCRMLLQSPENAMNQYNRIAKGIEGLDIFPERVHVMESESEHSMRLRQFPIDNFSAFYIIEGDSVIVTRVLYSASDISRRLRET